MIARSNSFYLRLSLLGIISGLFLGKLEIFYSASSWFLLGGLIGLGLAVVGPKIRGFFGLATLCFGIFYAHIFSHFTFHANQIPKLIGQRVVFTGTITNFPEQKTRSQTAFFRADSFQLEPQPPQKIREFLLLSLPRDFELDYGDQLKLLGVPTLASNSVEFQYRSYLQRYGIQAKLKNPRIFSQIPNGGNPIIRTAKKFRNHLATNLQTHLPPLHAGLATGLILGVKKPLPEPSKSWFKDAGFQHLLVVSGSNVTLLFFVLYLLFRRLGRVLITIINVPMLLFFVLMTGADPPVVRAAIMAGFFLLAEIIGRQADGQNLVLIAALLMGLSNPQIIQKDISFWLSFSAMLGIVCLTPYLYVKVKKLPLILAQAGIHLPLNLDSRLHGNEERKKSADFSPSKLLLLLLVTLSAQIGVFPVAAETFGNWPLVGLLSNVIVEPLIPFLMAAIGLAGTGIGILAWPAHIGLEILLMLAKWFGGFWVMPIPSFVAIDIGVIFGGFCLWSLFSKKYATKYLAVFERETR